MWAACASSRENGAGPPIATTRLTAWAEAGMKDHGRWLLARRQLERKTDRAAVDLAPRRPYRPRPRPADRQCRHDRKALGVTRAPRKTSSPS